MEVKDIAEEGVFDFVKEIHSLIWSHLRRIGVVITHEEDFESRQMDEFIVIENQIVYAYVFSPVLPLPRPEEGPIIFEIYGDHTIVSLEDETLILSFSFINDFYTSDNAPSSSWRDDEVENIIKVSNYGLETLKEDIINELREETRVGNRFTLFPESIEAYFGRPFLTRTNKPEILEVEINDTARSFNVVLVFDIVDEKAYAPPSKGAGGRRYEEAKGRFEKRK